MNEIRVLDHGFVRLVDSMGGDLSVVRAARVSYDADWRAGEDEGSDARLIRYLWQHQHTTPFEAVTFTFEVKAPIFVLRQWHRHRTWCLSGDTLISFELPDRLRAGKHTAKQLRLDDLFRKWQPTIRTSRPQRQTNALRPRSRIQRMLLRVYDESTGIFTTSQIQDIVASGVKQVFEITLKDGKTLKCSKDHLLLTTNGWQRLQDAVGLVLHGTTAGMTKDCRVLTNGYQAPHVPWNKGVAGYKTSRTFTDKQRTALRAARSGPGSNFWQGGITSDRQKIAAWTTRMAPKVHARFDFTCQACGRRGGTLHAHHMLPVVSHPTAAYDLDNLETRCAACHALEHGKTGESRLAKGVTLRAMHSLVVSIRLVGEEATYDISVAGDHHNFVANGMIVHNSFNELSARYKELPEDYYLPAVDQVGKQSTTNKQGRDFLPDYPHSVTNERDALDAAHRAAFGIYRLLLSRNWPRELARTVLPLATYSHMFATVDLLNLLKFLTLRCDEHAQWEIQQYANALRDLAKIVAPVCMAAWEETV